MTVPTRKGAHMNAIVARRIDATTAEVVFVGSTLAARRHVATLVPAGANPADRDLYVFGGGFRTVDGSPIAVGSIVLANRD